MSDSGKQVSVAQVAPAQSASLNFNPTNVVTVPDHADWHLISDHELDELDKPEGGVLGSLGFTALGAILGALPGAVAGWKKVGTTDVLRPEEIVSLMVTVVAIVAAGICLTLFAIYRSRSRGAAARIRQRKKVGPNAG
jgi:hypothetical protein